MARRVLNDAQRQELSCALQGTGIPNAPYMERLGIGEWYGRGKGLYAIMKIPKGTSILVEKALFYINNVEDPLSRANIEDIDKKAKRFVAFRELSCPFLPNTHQTRFQTNNFEMTSPHGTSKRGIFPQASRLNHSCLPNAHFAWNNHLQRLTVHGIHDIANNAEIVVNYCLRNCYMDRISAKRYSKTTTISSAIIKPV